MDKFCAFTEGGGEGDTVSSPRPNTGDISKASAGGDFGHEVSEDKEASPRRFPVVFPERHIKNQRPPITQSVMDDIRSNSNTSMRLPPLAASPRNFEYQPEIVTGYRLGSAWRQPGVPAVYQPGNRSVHGRPNFVRGPTIYYSDSLQSHSRVDQRPQSDSLPLEIRWKVRNDGIVKEHFGSEITVATLKNDNIVEVAICHVILLLDIVTNQYWVKCYTKHTRSQQGSVLKFGRLVTRNLSPEILGNTSFLFGSGHAHLDFPPYSTDKHMLNFFDRNMAAKFEKAFHQARNQVWNHAAIRLQLPSDSNGHRPVYPVRTRTYESSLVSNAHRNSSTLNRHSACDFPNTSNMSHLLGSGSRLDTVRVSFRAYGVRLYMKVVIGAQAKTAAFALLAEGDLRIDENSGEYDQLLFFGPSNEIIFDHLIYPWNQPSSVQQLSGTEWECHWIAAANHLITKSPRNVPVAREFKIVGTKIDVLSFNEALTRSATQALKYRLASPRAERGTTAEQGLKAEK